MTYDWEKILPEILVIYWKERERGGVIFTFIDSCKFFRKKLNDVIEEIMGDRIKFLTFICHFGKFERHRGIVTGTVRFIQKCIVTWNTPNFIFRIHLLTKLFYFTRKPSFINSFLFIQDQSSNKYNFYNRFSIPYTSIKFRVSHVSRVSLTFLHYFVATIQKN